MSVAEQAAPLLEVEGLVTRYPLPRGIVGTLAGRPKQQVHAVEGVSFSLAAGEIAEQGPMEDLFHDPRHPYTRLLFAATPDLHGAADVVSIPGTPPRLDREIEGCPFAPRCDRAFDPCAKSKPRRLAFTPEHEAVCHLNDTTVAVAR